MVPTSDEVLKFVGDNDVKFIRLAFCDEAGKLRNVSVTPEELGRASASGVAIDGGSAGFPGAGELLLFPDPSTLAILPWRPSHGRVVRLYCMLKTPDGEPFSRDARRSLAELTRSGAETFRLGFTSTFTLYKLDESGEPTNEPHDRAGYLEVAPADRGENVRREIILNLANMDVASASSYHESAPGEHALRIEPTAPLRAADDYLTFRWAAETAAAQYGLHASFLPVETSPRSGLTLTAVTPDGIKTRRVRSADMNIYTEIRIMMQELMKVAPDELAKL